jgi:hypothetical protein
MREEERNEEHRGPVGLERRDRDAAESTARTRSPCTVGASIRTAGTSIARSCRLGNSRPATRPHRGKSRLSETSRDLPIGRIRAALGLRAMLLDATASAVSRQMNRQKFPSPLYAYVLALSAIACGSDAAPSKDPEVGALNAHPSGQGGSGASPDSIPGAAAQGQADPENVGRSASRRRRRTAHGTQLVQRSVCHLEAGLTGSAEAAGRTRRSPARRAELRRRGLFRCNSLR